MERWIFELFSTIRILQIYCWSTKPLFDGQVNEYANPA